MNIEQNISNLIESLFPSFYKTDGENFVAFVKAYYEWMETEGSESRKILEYRDIDTTVDEFLDYFKNEYLNGLPATTQIDRKLLVKHIKDLYRSKGSTQSFKLFFKLVFNEDVDVYDPSVDVLRASDGVWTIPKYLECSASNRTISFIGKKITGATSGATAFVENVVRRKIKERFVDIVYISNVYGNFETGEYISSDNSLLNSPYIIGSLNSITLTSGGSNNAIGDVFDVTSEFGQQAQAKVTAITDGTGKVDFTLLDGGYGFSNSSTVLISSAVLNINNVNGAVQPLMSVVQPLDRANYNILSGANTFVVMDSVVGSNSTNTSVATGYIVSLTASNTTAGNVVISTVTGDWRNANTITLLSNSSITANVLSVANISSFATIVDSNSTTVGLTNVSGNLYAKAYIKFYVPEPIGLSSSNTATANVNGFNTYYSTLVANDDLLYFRANNGIIGKVKNVNSNTLITLTSNSTYTFTNTTIWHTAFKGSANTGSLYSSGSGATFKIGSLSNTESITVGSDLISANNSGLVPFLDMLIDGSNSNVASNAYGFSSNTGLGYNNVMFYAFGNTTLTIGTIKALSSINPGNNYNINPTVNIIERYVAGYDKKDITIDLSNTNYLFSTGQQLRQEISEAQKIVRFSSNTGTFLPGEVVIQQTSGANGVILSTTTNSITVSVLSGNFVAGNNVIGQVNGGNAAVSAVDSLTVVKVADGLIRSVSGNTVTIRKTSFNTDFQTGNVYSVDDNSTLFGSGFAQFINTANSRQMGFNSSVNTEVKTATGIVTEVEIIDSGFGFIPNESVTLTKSSNSNITLFGDSIVVRQGTGTGYWKNNNGKLNSDKYIHDNYYYQEYSYEIQSKMSLNSYSDILKKVLHVSGNELFGGVRIKSTLDINVESPGARITTS